MIDLPTRALWLFTALLIARVLGQLIVVQRAPHWLPPMAQWQSGLVPYPVLLAVQAVVVSLMIWISIDFSRRAGYWFEPHPRLGLVVLWWSYLYAGAMVGALRRSHDAAARPAMARRHDSDHLPHRGGRVPVDVRRSITSPPLSRAADDPRVAADVVQAAPDVVVVPDEVQVALVGADDTVVAARESAAIELDQRPEHTDGRAIAGCENHGIERLLRGHHRIGRRRPVNPMTPPCNAIVPARSASSELETDERNFRAATRRRRWRQHGGAAHQRRHAADGHRGEPLGRRGKRAERETEVLNRNAGDVDAGQRVRRANRQRHLRAGARELH